MLFDVYPCQNCQFQLSSLVFALLFVCGAKSCRNDIYIADPYCIWALDIVVTITISLQKYWFLNIFGLVVRKKLPQCSSCESDERHCKIVKNFKVNKGACLVKLQVCSLDYASLITLNCNYKQCFRALARGFSLRRLRGSTISLCHGRLIRPSQGDIEQIYRLQ